MPAIFTINDYLEETEWKPQFQLVRDHLEKLFEIAKKLLFNKEEC